MKAIVDALGAHAGPGLAVLVLACLSLFALEVIRQTRVALAPRALLAVRIGAGALTAVAFLLIVIRFVHVGGVI